MNRTPLGGAPARRGSGTYVRAAGSHTNVIPSTDGRMTGTSAAPASVVATARRLTASASPASPDATRPAALAATPLLPRATACRLAMAGEPAALSTAATPASTRAVLNRPGRAAVL